jgi:hypothetical protein
MIIKYKIKQKKEQTMSGQKRKIRRYDLLTDLVQQTQAKNSYRTGINHRWHISGIMVILENVPAIN